MGDDGKQDLFEGVENEVTERTKKNVWENGAGKVVWVQPVLATPIKNTGLGQVFGT